MDYQQAQHVLDNLQFFKIKLGLESMSQFLDSVGNPHRGLRFVHVAGTNGKGSVSTTLRTILTRAGYKVGLYTSPHLSCVRERFRIDERFISEEAFARQASAIREALGGAADHLFRVCHGPGPALVCRGAGGCGHSGGRHGRQA